MSRDAGAVFEANVRTALASWHARTQASVEKLELPFDRLLLLESDGADADPGEYEIAQRIAGVRAFFRYIGAGGPNPLNVLKRLYDVGAGINIPMFSSLTMEERALLLGESKGAVSFRLKMLSDKVSRRGMGGNRLPGQKSGAGTANYSKAQQGNSNRRKKRRKKKVIA